MRSNSRNFFNKFYKRLSAFLKLKKYKKISFHRSLIKKGLSARKTFKYNGLRYQYHLNKNIIRQIAQGVTNSTTHVPVGQNSTTILTPFDIVLRKDMSNLSAKEILDDKLDLIITKKKGGILSYLHSVFCRYPKKYMYRFLGREIYRKYYTMPYRLSVNRYVSYLIFKNYYGIGSARILKRKNGGKQNAVRRIVESTEQRLDSSVLRVLLYKPCFTYKTLSNQRKNVPNALKVKSPWSVFPSGHIQQLISHGHICVNGRIVRHGNVKIRGHDLIHFKKTSNSFLKGPKILTLPGEESKLLRIKSLAPLGFTKLFYITYRNMYLVNRDLIISTPNQVYYRGIEKNIMCAFHAIELDQSSYLLWPIFSLLKVADFVKTIKPYVLTDKGRVSLTKEDKWNRRLQLQRLLRWKRLDINVPTRTIPNQMLAIIKQDPSLMYTRFTRCYASIVYGTRRCEWIQLQQRRNGGFFYRNLPYKINFLESELEYYQLAIRHYI